MSLFLELAAAVLQPAISVPLNKGVASANTGNAFLDWLPLLTMAPCVQTLHLYWRRRRFVDFTVFGTGFLLAIIYHICHMHPEGIANAHLLGLSGPAWRGLDILAAQALLARTLGHAVGAQTTLVTCLANLVFPAALLLYTHLLADGVLTLGIASKVLLLTLIATLAAKATVEGFHTIPKYCPQRGKRTLACFACGFAVFPLPELFPKHYWFFHSVWHVLMAAGYQNLYYQLEGYHLMEGEEQDTATAASPQDTPAHQLQHQRQQRLLRLLRRRQLRSAAATLGPRHTGAWSYTTGAGGVQAPLPGWLAALLQPWERLAVYQDKADQHELVGEEVEQQPGAGKKVL